MNEPYFAEGTPAMVELEAMVDRVGLRNVLYALQHICYGKADHIQANWQDSVLAKQWEIIGHKLSQWAESVKLD